MRVLIAKQGEIGETFPNATVKNGFIVDGKKPFFNKSKIENDGLNIADFMSLEFDNLTEKQLRYVWRLDKEYEGKKFVWEELCDERTEKYLDETKKDLRYVETIGGYEEALGDAGYNTNSTSETGIAYINTSTISIVELVKDEKEYIGLQYSMQTDIDDYVIVTSIFSDTRIHRNSDLIDTLETANAIEDIKWEILWGKWKDTIRCWECGTECHWIDINKGDIVEKYRAKKEKYCGC